MYESLSVSHTCLYVFSQYPRNTWVFSDEGDAVIDGDVCLSAASSSGDAIKNAYGFVGVLLETEPGHRGHRAGGLRHVVDQIEDALHVRFELTL